MHSVIVKPPRSLGSSVSKFFSKIARDETSGMSAASRAAAAGAKRGAASHGGNSLGSLTVSSSLWNAYEDSAIMLRIFFYALPCAFVLLAMEGFVDAPWFFDVALVTLVAAGLSMQNEWSSRAATLVRLYSGHFVTNLNCNRQGPQPFLLYDRHRDADCRVLREALSMLGLDVEVRPCPDPVEGVPSPWLEELQDLAIQEREQAARDDPTGSAAAAALAAVAPSKPVPLRASFDPSTPLPHLSSLPSCPVPPALQGQGFPLVQVLLRAFALEPAGAFPLDMDEKPTRVSCMLASRVRAYLPWGARAHPIDWDRVHEARLAAAQAEADEEAEAAAAAEAASAAALQALTGPGNKRNSATSPRGATLLASPKATPAAPAPALAATHQRAASSSALKTKAAPAAAPPAAKSKPAAVPTGSPSSVASANHGAFDASVGRRSSTVTSTAMHVALERKISATRSVSVQGAPGGEQGAAELAAAASASAASSETFAAPLYSTPRVSLPRISSVRDLLPLSLYGHESSAKCRPVFELACSLQLSYILRTCAQGSLNRAKLVLDYGSLFDLPTLIDPNTRVVIVGSTPCVNYLMSTYAMDTY